MGMNLVHDDESCQEWNYSLFENLKSRLAVEIQQVYRLSVNYAELRFQLSIWKSVISQLTVKFQFSAISSIKPYRSDPPHPPGGVLPEKLVGVYGPLPKTLTLFITKICDIPYPVYDLTKNSKPYL